MTRQSVDELIDGYALMVAMFARWGFAGGLAAIAWVGDRLGPLLLGYVLDRYALLVSAGQDGL